MGFVEGEDVLQWYHYLIIILIIIVSVFVLGVI